MRLNSFRGTTVVTPKPSKRFPWVRVLIAIVILAIAAYLILPNVNFVRADAEVRGYLVPVTPEFRARLDTLLVGCSRSVRAGEPVAIVSNFLLQADYKRQYLQSQADFQRQYLQSAEQSQLAKSALEQNVATSRANAAALHEKYMAASLDAQRLQGEYASYDQAYKAGAVARVTRDAKSVELRGSQAVAAGALEAWTASKLLTRQIGAAQESRIVASQNLLRQSQISQALLDQSQDVEKRLGKESLKAPVSGDIVDCVERPQNVIEAGTPILNIFPHDKAYVVAYFNPDAVAKVHIGAKAAVSITGLSHNVAGRVAWIYPNLDALPPQLTRFFWQRVQFSEYRPVKIVLVGLGAREREQLYYNAQARVSIATPRQFGLW